MTKVSKEGKPQYHSAVITLSMLNLKKIHSREYDVGIFWRLMGRTKRILHNNQEKPYMFYFRTLHVVGMNVNPFDCYRELVIHSIDPVVIDTCINNVRKLIKAGEAVDVQGVAVRPIDAYPIKDLEYIGKKVYLATETGCCCCKRIRTKSGKRSRYYLDPSKESDKEEWKLIIARKLATRAKRFLGEEVPDESIDIDILETGARQFVNYKSANLPTDFVKVKISAPAPIVFTAIYGGIGSHTGAGFGAVRVIKKKLQRGDAA